MRSPSFTCRACEHAEGTVILDMGRLPLANAFVPDERSTEDGFRESLTLMMCGRCRLIQLRDDVPREQLFQSYLWMTSGSAAAGAHARWLAARLQTRHKRKARPFLVEIASNDGYFLRHFREAGFEILGVDPSNFAAEADARGLPSLREFFGVDVAQRIERERGRADLIVARNVLGHASKLRDLVGGIDRLLAPDGVVILETPYAYFLREELQYDTIFHEHPSYPTLGSLAHLLARFDMKLTDITFVPMNGGSFLCEAVRAGSACPRGDQALLDFEEIILLNDPSGWSGFERRVEAQRAAFAGLLQQLHRDGKRVLGYGAAAKCMTMLNYCGITREWLPAIGDANPRKQGLLCPGVRIPVVSPQQIADAKPDYVMIGAWNLQEEIMEFFRAKLDYRGGFIIPLPMPSVVS